VTLRDQVRDRAASLAAKAGVTIEHIGKAHIRKERLSGLSSDLSKRDSQYLGACGRSHPARHEAGTVLAAVKAASRRYAVAFGQP
jgi:hypothetical protein